MKKEFRLLLSVATARSKVLDKYITIMQIKYYNISSKIISMQIELQL
jgi:hypothetical protein